MRYLCLFLPLLWLLGSLDHGILSGQEILSVVVVAALAWGTWRTFKLFSGSRVTRASTRPPQKRGGG
jgi:hypothetical protein